MDLYQVSVVCPAYQARLNADLSIAAPVSALRAMAGWPLESWFHSREFVAQAQIQHWLLTETRGIPLFLLPNDRDFARAAFERNAGLLSWLQEHKRWRPVAIAAELRVSIELLLLTVRRFGLREARCGLVNVQAEEAFRAAWTPELRASILAQVHEGYDRQTLALGLGVRPSVLRMCLAADGVPDCQPGVYTHKNVGRALTKTTRAWLEDAKTCSSIADLATLWQLTESATRARLCYIGVVLPRKSATWAEDLDRAGSISAAAKAWGVSYQTAYLRARRLHWQGLGK
jgi:hypothetical protein